MVAAHISALPQRERQGSLSHCLEDAINRLSAEQIYVHPAHNFKQSGDRLRGGCPHHDSKSGSSFVVTISSKLFWCEGCQFGGNPADYRASIKAGRWVKARNKDFVEVVKELATDANVPFPERESSREEIAKAQKWERRRAVLAATQDYCQEVLWSDTDAALEARHYLVAERGLTEEEIKLLPIGYYPSAGEVKRHLISKGFTKEDWEGTGCYWKDMERYITFLWNDDSGRPLTIYGRYFRKHPPEGKPKTIATPGAKTKQSPLYFDRTLKAGHKEIILVEGVIDAVLLQAKGDTRVCAYVAASCSGDQIETLQRRRTTKATLCGDPDHGGEKGTNSNLLRLTEAGVSVYIAPKLPDELDPDEFLIREGIEGWNDHINAAIHGFRWKAERLVESGNVATDSGKADILKGAIAFCKAVKNHPELDIFFWPVIRSSLGMEPEDFRAQLERLWESSTAEVSDLGGGSGGSGGGEGGDGEGGDRTGKVVRLPSFEALTPEQVTGKIDELIVTGATGSYLTGQLNRLAAVSQYYIGELRKLYYERLGEADLEESRTERKAEVENLLRIGKYQLELQDYLDSAVACPLERVAGWMGTTPVAMLTTLYPVIGSLLEVGTRLELTKATDHYALPVIYTGLVCESGAGKTPAQKTILKPLFALQAEAEIEYKERLSEYQQELSEWKKVKDNDEPAPEQPVPHEYYTTDATSEAIALIQSQQPNRGFLGWFDELPALFKSQGQYKSGRGADGEKILSGRDGTGFKVNRASGKRLVVDQPAYSITGSLQPLILRQMMGDFTDANGQWARFLWTVMQVQPAPYPDDAIPFDVTGLLKGIYKRLKNLPATTYTLSPPAKKVYRRWYNELDQLKMSESRQGMRAVYSKMKGDTGVLALLLHCFNGCVHEGSTPDLEINEQTMVAAIKLAKYHIGQVKLIHSEGDVANGEIAAIHTKIIQLSERKGWLKAADVRDIDRQIKKQFTADDIRKHFRELEASGFGQTGGEGTKLMWSIYQDNDSPPVDKLRTNSGQTQATLKNTGNVSSHGVQAFVANYSGQTQDNSGQTQDTLKNIGSGSSHGVQQSSIKTQDTQDSFAVAQRNLVDVYKTGNEIQDAAPNFDVLSCPEFVSESRNSTTVCIPAQDKTQDNRPETVLSCPELDLMESQQEATAAPLPPCENPLESTETPAEVEIPVTVVENAPEAALSCPEGLESEEDIADLAEMLEFCSNKEMLAELRSTNGFTPSVMSKASNRLSTDKRSQIKEWVLQLNSQGQQQPHTAEAIVGERIRYSGEYSGELSAISKKGEFFITWDVSSQKQAQRHNFELPAVLKAGDFEVTPCCDRSSLTQ